MQKSSRRALLKKAGYVAPAVLTLTATPAMAQSGSSGRRMHRERRRDRPVRRRPQG